MSSSRSSNRCTSAAGDTLIQQSAGDAGLFLIDYGEADANVGDQLVNTIRSGDYCGEIAPP